MKKLLVALLMLGASNAFSMGVDAGWTNQSLLGNRPVVQTRTETTSRNARPIDADWDAQGLGINQGVQDNRAYNNAPAQPVESVDASWNIQDLR